MTNSYRSALAKFQQNIFHNIRILKERCAGRYTYMYVHTHINMSRLSIGRNLIKLINIENLYYQKNYILL